MKEWGTQEPESKGGGGDGEENENLYHTEIEKQLRKAGEAEEMNNPMLSMAVSEAGGSHSVTPKCLYVRTPSGGTMSDTEEQSCLRMLATNIVREDKHKELLSTAVLEIGGSHSDSLKHQYARTLWSGTTSAT